MKTFTNSLLGAACFASAVKGIELMIHNQAAIQQNETMFAQVEGCGDQNIGTPVLYMGPKDKAPDGYTYANNTPGMNLAQTATTVSAKDHPGNIEETANYLNLAQLGQDRSISHTC